MALDHDWAPAWRIAAAIKSGETSALAAVESALTRIERLNPKLNAFTSVLAERAREKAKAIDIAGKGAAGPLAGGR